MVSYVYGKNTTRQGEHPDGTTSLTTGIDVAYYNKDGIPYNGTSSAIYLGEAWVII